MDIANCVPKILNNYFQNMLVNLGSLSLTIIFGKPCRRNISLKNA